MYDLMITIMPASLWIIAALELGLTVMLFRVYRAKRRDKLPFLAALVAVGLFYDALILALGTFIPEGAALKALSQLRYVLHLFLIPIVFPICAMGLRFKPKALKTVWAVTLVIMLAGFIGGFFVHTEPRLVGGVMRYADDGTTPALVDALQSFLNYVPVFLLIGVGIYVMIKRKTPYLFLSGFFMLAFTLVGIFLGKSPDGDKQKSLMFFISMFGELLMTVSFLLYAKDERRTEK